MGRKILKENLDDSKGMALFLTIMMTISGSMAACEQGFSCMNSKKQTFIHNLQKKQTILCFCQLMVPMLTSLIPLHIQ